MQIQFAAKSAVRLRKAGFLILEKYYEFGLASCLGDKSGKLEFLDLRFLKKYNDSMKIMHG